MPAERKLSAGVCVKTGKALDQEKKRNRSSPANGIHMEKNVTDKEADDLTNIRSDLLEIIKEEERVLTGEIPHEYLSDKLGRKEGTAQAVVLAKSTDEVSRILKYAYNRNIPVTPRGAGTNLVGSTVPDQGGIILDVSGMNRILSFDPDTLSVTVQPGVLLKDVQAYVEERGLFYPPDPGEKSASIGGNIATNAGGMRAVKYGVTRDYVRALEVVTADGKVLNVGSKNVKDTTGLSLKNLVIGSEGTLAVITGAVLRLVAKPEAQISIVVPYPDLRTGIESVLTLLRADLNPVAIEFMERKVVAMGEKYTGIAYPRPDAGSYILLSFDGHKEIVEESVRKASDLARETGAMDFVVLNDREKSNAIWAVRGDLVNAVEAVSEQEPLDIVVPIDRTADFVEYVNALEVKTGIRLISFGHAGDGNVHLCVVRGDRDEETWEKDLDQVLTELYEEVRRMGGLISGEHGLGVSKRKYFFHETSKEIVDLMNRVKDAFDPKHILNDQKSYVR